MSTAAAPPPSRLRRLRRALLAPGTLLMHALPMSAKLALLAGSLLLPMALLVSQLMQAQWHQRELTLGKLRGVAIADALLPVMLETQKHRGLSLRVQAGERIVQAQRDDARRALAASLATMDAALARHPGHGLDDTWPALRHSLQGLAEGKSTAHPAETFAFHARAVESLRQLAMLNLDRAGLMLDDNPRSLYLVESIGNTLLPTLEAAAVVRDLGASQLAIGQGSRTEQAGVLGHAGQIEHGLDSLAVKLAAYERAGGAPLAAWPSMRDSLQKLIQRVTATFVAAAPSGSSANYFDQASAAIDQMQGLYNEASVNLQRELTQRLQHIERAMAWQAALIVGGVLLLGYLQMSFLVTFRKSLHVLRAGTDAMAQGDLAHRTQVPGRDELAAIGHTVDNTCGRLSGMVAEIRTSAALVNLAGSQVADGSQRLSDRTDEQATSLRSSVDAIGHLSQAVADNARAARDLDSLTEGLFNQAREGHEAMAETVGAMTRMQAASQRVTEVVKVIDDVAFQTGMLSLNAAVEAARAGEAGKGFGVVASEVRQLARRCAESADEIRQLIGDASEHVEVSAAKLRHVSGSLDTIVSGVQEVSGRLRAISTASTQQSAGLGEVTASVGNLDKITRENAALVEMSATASNTLVERAHALRDAVVSMRLRQASADEAHALLERAVAHVDAKGRDQAFADFHDPEGGFIDRDLYVFIFDRNGIISVFGAKPALVGEPAGAIQGLEPTTFLERAWAAADVGGGWIQYEVANPRTREVTPKESFILPLGKGEFIGCGAYRREGSGKTGVSKPRARAYSAA
jgi:methyl-accepting chemotaxis protein